jgi:hypothetical protein
MCGATLFIHSMNSKGGSIHGVVVKSVRLGVSGDLLVQLAVPDYSSTIEELSWQ